MAHQQPDCLLVGVGLMSCSFERIRIRSYFQAPNEPLIEYFKIGLLLSAGRFFQDT